MIVYIGVSVFLLMIAYFFYISYKNEKRYQKERKENRYKRQERKRTESTPTPKETSTPSPRKKVERERPAAPSRTTTVPPKEAPAQVQEKTAPEAVRKSAKEPEKTQKSIPVSLGNYPDFSHARLLKMGLSEEEAQEFVAELIPQIETQIPLIEEALTRSDFHAMERLTHSIKGSSTTVGSGGVSDLLVDFNTYLKSGTEPAIIEAYIKELKHYCHALEAQYRS
jgi:HPt (histidine-containing phosphotransfer) domain-containing protein